MAGGRRTGKGHGSSRQDRVERHHRSQLSASGSSDDQFELDDEAFTAKLKINGLYIRDVESDGSCLFRAISDQLYGSENRHEELRATCVRYMRGHEESFAPFIEDDRSFASYTAEMSRDSVWGGNLELQALSMALQLDVRIHQLDGPVYDIRNSFRSGVRPTPIHLSYHQGQHYASVRRRDSETMGGPALHPKLSTRRARVSDEDSSERSGALHEEPPAIVTEAKARAKCTEDIVAHVLELLRTVRRRATLNPSADTDSDTTSIASEKNSEMERAGFGTCEKSEGPTVSAKAVRALEMQASDIRELVRDAVSRSAVVGMHEHDSSFSLDGAYNKKLQKSRRRVYQMLDTSLSLANDLEAKAKALGTSSQSFAVDQSTKRPVRGKKKQQAAKRAERKARRLREQERAAGVSLAKEPNAAKGTRSSEVAI